MEYHSTGSPTARLGGSVPNPTDLSRRLLSTQQAQEAAESRSDDEGATTPKPRSRLNSVTRFDISPGTPFWGSYSPAPRSPVLIQCCCKREDCQNLLAFLESTRSMEGELRLAAKVGQALLQKHELYQKEMEYFRSALEHQKSDTLVTALDKSDSVLRDLDTELKARDNEIKRLLANNIKGERSEEREEMLRQLEGLQQELAVSRKSELAAEMRVKKLTNKFDQLYNAHEKLQKEQIETQRSKHKLEAIAMLRESNERSNKPNNEANNHLIALIKELSSANNKLKYEISEYRELLSESRNEISTLQNHIEDDELERYVMKHKRPGRNSIRKGKKVFVEIGEEGKDDIDAAQSDITERKRERNDNELSNSDITKSKTTSTKPPIPAFKNPKFAILGLKQMIEAWCTGVAMGGEESETMTKEIVNNSDIEDVKSRMDSTNSPIKEFVEEVLVDEAAAEAAVLANEVEHSFTHSRHDSTATLGSTMGENLPNVNVEESGEGSNIPPESAVKPILPYIIN